MVGIVALVLVLAVGAAADEVPVTPAVPAPVKITTRAEPTSVTIGTPFRYVMRVEARGEVELFVPILAERIGDFIITDFGEVPNEDPARAVVERWYDLVTYEAGEQLVPGPTVQYRVPGSDLERIDAEDQLIVVKSLLAAPEKEGGAPDLRDIKRPVAVPRDYRPLLWAAAALVLLIAVGFLLYRLLNRDRHSAHIAPRPAHEIALEALKRLRAARLVEGGRQGEYYVQLSAIIRAYLEGRFQLRAPEMTTEEFLQVAQRNPQLRPEHRTQLGRFLSEADLVKFARHVPSVDDAERAYTAAGEFVESTIPAAEAQRAAA